MPLARLLAFAVIVALLAALGPPPTPADAAPDHSSKPYFRVLVFHRGAPVALRNAGVAALRQLGKELNFAVEATDDPARFVPHQLARFRAVVFLNTGQEVLNEAQQAAFEDYFRLGGGFLGIGTAIETEPTWPFMDELLAARATDKTAVQPGTIKVADRVHEATKDVPEYWLRTDAWYNLAANPRGFVHVLATVVEERYAVQPSGETLEAIEGGTMGFDHPVSWCRDWKGGRSFVITGGHTPAAYSEPLFRSHLAGAILWAAGRADPVYSDCGATVWANYQQTKIASPPNVGEPIGFDVLPDGRILQTTRLGEVRLHDPATGTTQVIATLPVYTHSEDGLYGPAIDNDFELNRWVYLFYAPATVTINGQEFTTPAGSAPTTPRPDPEFWTDCPNSVGQCWLGYFQLSRFKFVDGPSPYLDLATEQKILQVPVDRGACCHVGGDIDFDADNNLWLVTGDDTPAGAGNSGGFGPFNDQLTYESQTVAVSGATGGSFTLTLDGQTTEPIAVPITNAALEAALEALPNIDDVAVTGTTTRTVQFRGLWAERDVPQMTADSSGLVGTAPTVTVATSQQGGWYNPPFFDARRSALNTNDLRGKILRIKVQEDGSYTIPPGNLFPPGTPGTRPEIYAMGLRNPFRIQVDSKGIAYVADYSPDSRVPQNFRGPAGTGRILVVRQPANYGWPLCYGPDLPYYRWNFITSQPLDNPPRTHECDNPARGPENASRWNTGLTTNPPISKPDVWYSFDDNNDPTNPLGTPCFAYYNGSGATTCPQLFPELGPGGGVGPHSATTYEFDPANPNPTKFPPYFDGAVFFGEFTRDYLREIRLDSAGNVFKINDLLSCGAIGAQTPARPFECDNPMDFQFGPDGTFYLLTYGDGFFRANPDAGMYRFEYVKGQRAPVAEISASPTSGPAPLTVVFSANGSRDPDPGDSIRFEWDFQNDGIVDSTDPSPTFTYATRGQFTARLTVIDSTGRSASASTVITVGNTAPTIAIDFPVEGGLFAFGESIPFSVTVTDPEDGVIDCGRVEVTFVLGHDDHGHGQANAFACTGILPTNADDVSHGGNVFGVISATYTDLGGPGGVPALTTVKQTTIRQKRNEVEFVLQESGTNVAATADVGGGQQRGSLGNGDWLRLNGPFNLVNINAITFRVSSATAAGTPTGQVEVRLDSVDGPILTTVTILGTGSNTTYASQTFPITDPGGLHHIYLVFRPVAGGPTNNFFNLNWVEFVGQGIAVAP